jgi:hypothetical protein
MDRTDAQHAADRIALVREELAKPALKAALALTPEQLGRLEEWVSASLSHLAGKFDIDVSTSQKRMSWGMRIASTLGGLALCAALVLFFMRFRGYLDTPIQVIIVLLAPLAALAGMEFAARRERTLYFAGLMAMVALTSFVMNLVVIGEIFNIASTERALLAWGLFALLIAYRHGLRLILALALATLVSYSAAAVTARLGYNWLDFGDRPEFIAILGLIVFSLPFAIEHRRNRDFPPVYRIVGALTFLISVLSLAEWSAHSYLPFEQTTLERLYELVGLAVSVLSIWLGIARNWTGIVNTGATFFTIFLFCRFYHWLWDWMPQYLFFALIGALGIALVAGFKRMRNA